MKFKLLLLFVMLTCTVQAQVPGYFKFSFSDYAGNGITADGRGAIYNFNNGINNNCSTIPIFAPLNHQSTSTTSIALDSANGYLQINVSTGENNHHYFSHGFFLIRDNCQWTPLLDFRNPAHCVIEARVRSGINIDQFTLLPVARNYGWWVGSDGVGASTVSLNAGQWTTVKVAAILTNSSIPLDSTLITGVIFKGWQNDNSDFAGLIEVDYVRLGSAVQSTPPNAYELGHGTSWTVDPSTPINCPKWLDVLNNPNVDALYDGTSNEFSFTQTADFGGEIFVANVFSDEFCIPLPIDMSNPAYQGIDIDIYSANDVPEFAIDLNGYDENGIWDVGTLPAFQPLVGGQVNHLHFDMPLTTVNGTNFNLKRITGYSLFVPANPTLRTTSTAQVFSVSGVTAGTATTVATSTNSRHSSVIGLYPNPAVGGRVFIDENKSGLLQVFDLSGKVVFQQDIKSGAELMLPMAPGLYMVQLTNEQGVTYTEKLNIQ